MRTKKTIITFLTDAIPQILIMFIGIYKSKIFLSTFNTDTYGLYQLYSQIIAYLTLFESGMTGAVLYRLFKPIVDKDNKKISSIAAASKTIFEVVAGLIWSVGFVLVFVIPYLINNNPFKLDYIMITFMLYISSNAIFYLFATYRIVLDAGQKKYLTNIISQVIVILKSLIEIILVLLGYGLITILCVGIVSSLLSGLVMAYICKKYFPQLNLKEKKDFSMLKDAKNVLVYKFSGLIANNIDLIIISKFINLYNVVIYSSYNYICNSIRQLSSRVYVSVIPFIGDLYVTAKDKCEEIFYEYNSFVFYLGTVVCVPLLISINGFIGVWYDGKIEVSNLLAIAFTLNLFYAFIRQPLLTLVESTGIYKDTLICPFLEIFVNLTLSIIFVRKFGVPGVLFATFTSYIISEFLIKPRIITKKLFDNNSLRYYSQSIFLLLIFAIAATTVYILCMNVKMHNMLEWFSISAVIFFINLIIITLVYKLTNNLKFMNRLLKRKGK